MCKLTERLWSVFHRKPVECGPSTETNHSIERAQPEAAFLSSTPKSAAGWTFLLAHPFLLAIAPIIHLYSQNRHEADAAAMWIFIAGTLALTTVVFLCAWFILRDRVKAALLSTGFNVLFYMYGHAFDYLMRHEPVKLSYKSWHLILLTLGCTIVVLAGVMVRHSRRNLLPLSRFLSGTLAILLSFSVIQIVHNDVRNLIAGNRGRPLDKSTAELPDYPRATPLETDSPATPDVYYIILDGYSRADTLQRVCNFDNSEFIDILRSRGFYVADESCSNYPFTFMSLASSMNMCYLDEAVIASPGGSLVWALWDRGAVARVFQSKGYRFVYFPMNFKNSFSRADVVFQPRPAWLLSQFAEVLLRTSALRIFESQMAQQHLYQFENIKQVPKIAGPTFTYCHIIAPHPPYVFDRFGHVQCDVPQSMFFKDGEEQHRDAASQKLRQAYVEQVRYVNQRVAETVDWILANSSVPPIILIQGDHGTFFTLPGKINDDTLDQFAEERLPILNAYLVPEKMRAKLRPDISPVNSFRLLFNECFGEQFELLPEKHLVGWYYGTTKLRDATGVVHPSASQPAAAVAERNQPSQSSKRREAGTLAGATWTQ